MSELLLKLGLDPALPQKKLRAALKEERKNAWAQMEYSAAAPRQKILLQMHMEDIRKAEQSLPPPRKIWPVRFLSRFQFFEDIFEREKKSLNAWPANLSLFLALLLIAALFVGDLYHSTASDPDAFLALFAVVCVPVSLGAFLAGILSIFITTGAEKRKIFGIGLGFALVLLIGLGVLETYFPNNGFIQV